MMPVQMKAHPEAAERRTTSVEPVEPAAVLAVCPDPILVLDEVGRIVWGNRAAEEQFGWLLAEAQGRSAADFVHPDDLATALGALQTVLLKERGSLIHVRLRDASGTYRRYEVRGRSAVEVSGVGGIVLMLHDVSDRDRWAIGNGNDGALAVVLEHTPAITMVLEADGTIRSTTRALTRLIGRDLEYVIGTPFSDLARAEDRDLVTVELAKAVVSREPRSFEAHLDHDFSERSVPLTITVTNLLDDEVVCGLVVTAIDITALVEARARLEHMATHDSLTELPNRALLDDRLAHALARAQRKGHTVSVAFCDVDDFKTLNDTFGHLAGDRVLVEVARRLHSSVRATDTVARMHGDEFVVVIEGTPGEVDAVMERIRRAFDEPVVLPSGNSVAVAASIGYVVDDGTSSPRELIARADAAMYADKGRRSRPSV